MLAYISISAASLKYLRGVFDRCNNWGHKIPIIRDTNILLDFSLYMLDMMQKIHNKPKGIYHIQIYQLKF